jgi:tyrosine-specific transport protein
MDQSQTSHKNGSVFGAALLISGTTIGAGMLALPVLTAFGGFYPSMVLFFFCWLFMAATGLLLAEVTIWMKPGANLISMAEQTLGSVAKAATWVLYLFFFYLLTIAYIAEGGRLVEEILGSWLSREASITLFVLVFGFLVYLGAYAVDRANWLLMTGLALSYAGLVFLGSFHIKTSLLEYQDWNRVLLALPVAFGSFAYQGSVPTIVDYLRRDPIRLRKAILYGSFIPLIVYGIWTWLVQGVVPIEGPGGLLETLKKGQGVIEPLTNFIEAEYLIVLANSFGFFAIVTSFIGVTLGVRDFLADGLRINKDAKGRLFLCALIFLPTMAVVFWEPGLFLAAFGLAGGIGTAFLLGFFPIMMAWVGRYTQGRLGPRLLPGGKPVLVVLLIFLFLEVGVELRELIW